MWRRTQALKKSERFKAIVARDRNAHGLLHGERKADRKDRLDARQKTKAASREAFLDTYPDVKGRYVRKDQVGSPSSYPLY